MRIDKKSSQRTDKKAASRGHKQGVVGYSKKSALLEDAITQMNAGKYGRSSAALKELLALDPLNMEARRLFATLHLRLGSLIPARQAFESLVNEAFERQDYWLAESLLREYLAAGPRCVPFLEKLGTIYHDKGDALAAVTEYGKAIDILIEDPDPDQPQLASQLYAKVRELAPASPVAFRLAAFFDAQSGELVARPKPAQPESGDSATASTEVSFTDETGLVSDSATSSDQGTGHPAAIADPFTGSPVGGAVSDYPRESSWSEESAVDVGDPNLAASGSVHSQTGPTSIESPAEQPAEERLTMGPSTETSEVRHGE
ncbi:MAG TPA: tetratricopeptide repeat protein, partial [Terriglobales bacterium]|nr:tetratricopeptide repeat protein [Terriglobales bacterium]